MSLTAWVTPTTHWDREWVMTQGQFQVRLVALMDRVLEIVERHPAYRFTLDGHALLLLDYLEIRPENRERITRHLKSGQLVAGPWYVLADQFLENGESSIRNLLFGMKAVRDLGGQPLMLGYVPDSFGSVATLPMVLNGFGIRYATFQRGRPSWDTSFPKTEVLWHAPDGSVVLASNHGYGNGLFLSYPDIWTDILHAPACDLEAAQAEFMGNVKQQRSLAVSDHLYFSVGLDHMEPKESLVAVVDHINADQTGVKVRFGTPEDYLRAVEKSQPDLAKVEGEMRGSSQHPMDLVGTISSRIKLKQANDSCELLLQRSLEPLWSLVSVLTGKDFPRGLLGKLWQLLLVNHPHDSMCGCSVEAVHDEMMQRFDTIRHTGTYLLKDGLQALAAEIDTRSDSPGAMALIVVNPLGFKRTSRVQARVRIPHKFRHDSYSIVDPAGTPIPATVRFVTEKQKDLESVYMTPDQLAEVLSKNPAEDRDPRQVFTVLDVDFVAVDVPAFGYATWFVKPGAAPSVKDESELRVLPMGAENEYLSVSFHDDGTFTLLDKKTGCSYPHLHHFVDRIDIGDSYDHRGTGEGEVLSRLFPVEWKLQQAEPGVVSYLGTVKWQVPQGTVGGKRTEKKVEEELQICVSVARGVPWVSIEVSLNNAREDHALRVAFDTQIEADFVESYDHFNVIKRPVAENEREWRDSPFQEFVDVSDQKHGLAIFTQGLPAYEAVRLEKGTRLYLTLLRSVGRIGPAAGADYPVPGAQGKGAHHFSYALYPHAGNHEAGECLARAFDYRTPFLVAGEEPHAGRLPAANSMLEPDEDSANAVFPSCFKQAEDKNGYIFRFWNAKADSRNWAARSSVFSDRCEVTHLDESTAAVTSLDAISVSGFALKTIRLSIPATE